MINNMEQRSSKSTHRNQGNFKTQTNTTDTKIHRNDSYVLDARISQQPFKIRLREGPHNSKSARDDADGAQRKPPPRWNGPIKTQDSKKPIDSRFDHDTRHHRGDGTG